MLKYRQGVKKTAVGAKQVVMLKKQVAVVGGGVSGSKKVW
jgi:hypothetical protein